MSWCRTAALVGYGLLGVTVAAALYIWQSGSWPAIKVRLLGKLLPRQAGSWRPVNRCARHLDVWHQAMIGSIPAGLTAPCVMLLVHVALFLSMTCPSCGILAACSHVLCAMQDWLQHSQLGKSGFTAAFALIFLSELGDKTFFIAGLLAMKVTASAAAAAD